MESNDKEKTSCISILKSLIAPEKGGMQVNRLERTYIEEIGSRVPYQKFGFQSLTAFLTSIPEIHLDHNQLLHVRDPKMAHITAMVQAQRSTKSKKGARSKRPMFQSGGRAPVRTSFPSSAFRQQASSFRPSVGRPTASSTYKKPSFPVSQTKVRYNPVPNLLSKMPTVEYVNGVAIHQSATTQYNNNNNNEHKSGAYPKKPTILENNNLQSSSPIKPYSPIKSPATRRPTVESSSPARRTTIEYVNGIATTYIDGVEVKKAPIYSSPEPIKKPSVVYCNGETDASANQKSAAVYHNEEAMQSSHLSLQLNGRRRIIARPSHAKAMADIVDGLSRTQLNENTSCVDQQIAFANDWDAAGRSATQVVPDYASGDASTNGFYARHDYQSQPSTSGTHAPDTQEYHSGEWNAGSRQPMESQTQQSSSDGSSDTRQLQEEAASVQITPVHARLSKVHQRLKCINRHRERAEVAAAAPSEAVPEAPHRSVVFQGGNGLLTISVDNAASGTTDAAGLPVPAPPSDIQLEYESETEKWKLESLKLTLRPMYAGYQLIGDNFFLGLAKTPEINAPCTALGGEDFRSGLCISGLTVLECNTEVFNARVISNKIMIMMGAMDILTGKSFTELKIQAIGLLEILLEKTRVTSICLCTIPPLLSATPSQRECQLEYNKWIKGMVQGSRLFSCCDLFAKFLTLQATLPEDEELYAKEPTCIDVVDRFVEVFLWNKEGCAAVLDEFKKVCC